VAGGFAEWLDARDSGCLYWMADFLLAGLGAQGGVGDE
jgi:hypothetical protein